MGIHQMLLMKGLAGGEPGWMTDVQDEFSTPLHSNSGTAQYDLDIYTHSMHAGIEGYSSGAVVWTPTWTPLYSDPAPTVVPLSGGRVRVDWPFSAGGTVEGLLTLAATVDGVPSASAIECVVDEAGMYNQMTWGPTP